MDRNALVLLACAGVSIPSFSALADVYKCADGKYQADPCDESSKPVDLSAVGSVVTGSNHPAQRSDDASKKQEISAYIDNQRVSREVRTIASGCWQCVTNGCAICKTVGAMPITT